MSESAPVDSTPSNTEATESAPQEGSRRGLWLFLLVCIIGLLYTLSTIRPSRDTQTKGLLAAPPLVRGDHFRPKSTKHVSWADTRQERPFVQAVWGRIKPDIVAQA